MELAAIALQELLERITSGLDECVQALSTSFPLPTRVSIGKREAFRHLYQDDLLLSFLKAVKIASAHNAGMLLLRAGYVQETYVLCRMIDEVSEDIWFMATPLGEGGKPSEDQVRFINEFFQEEFDDPDDPLSSSKRDRVSRQRIRAAMTRIAGSTDPSTLIAVSKTLYQAFSGFVHGAYVHILELFGGNPPRFHTRGMLGTPRFVEGLWNHVNYLYRSLLVVELVARRAGREDVTNRVADLSIELAQKTGCLDEKSIASALRRRARPFVKPS